MEKTKFILYLKLWLLHSTLTLAFTLHTDASWIVFFKTQQCILGKGQSEGYMKPP